MILCNCCNKKIKVKVRFLKTCNRCRLPVCKSCMTNNICRECHPLNKDEKLIYDYFKDKYMCDELKATGMVTR